MSQKTAVSAVLLFLFVLPGVRKGKIRPRRCALRKRHRRLNRHRSQTTSRHHAARQIRPKMELDSERVALIWASTGGCCWPPFSPSVACWSGFSIDEQGQGAGTHSISTYIRCPVACHRKHKDFAHIRYRRLRRYQAVLLMLESPNRIQVPKACGSCRRANRQPLHVVSRSLALGSTAST